MGTWASENLLTMRYFLLSAAAALFWVIAGLLAMDTQFDTLVGFFMLPGMLLARVIPGIFMESDWPKFYWLVGGLWNGPVYGVLLQVIFRREESTEVAPQPELGIHRGPSMHRIAPVAGFGGLVFTLGAMFIFLTVPQVRWFFGAALLAGGLIGLGLWWRNR